MRTITTLAFVLLLNGCATDEPATQPANWSHHPANPGVAVPPAPSAPQLAGEPVAAPTQPAQRMDHHHHGAHQ